MTDRENVEEDLARAQRARRLLYTAVGILCIVTVAGFVGAIVANVVNVNQGKKISRFSACEDDPAGALCQEIKVRSDKQRTVTSTCVLFEKVDRDGRLLRLTRCGRPVDEPVSSRGGGALQPDDQGPQQPGPRPGGQGQSAPADVGGHRDQGGPPPGANPNSPPGGPVAATPGSTTGRSAGEPPAAEPPPTEGATEQTADGVFDVVDQVGDEARAAGEDAAAVVDDAVCSTTPFLCTK